MSEPSLDIKPAVDTPAAVDTKPLLKRLVGYAAYMFGASLVTGLLNFGVSSLGMVTRSKEAVGDYALYMRIYQIGQGIFIFGANAAIQRFAADSPENRRAFTAFALRLFLLLSLVMGVAGVVVGVSIEWNYALALIGLPWLVVWWWGRYLVRSRLDAKREARLMMVGSLANTIFQFVFLTFTDWRDALIYGDFLALVVSGLVAIIYIVASEDRPILELLRAKAPRSLLGESFRFGVPVWWSGQIFQAQYQAQGLWTAAELGTAPMGALQCMETMWQFATKPLELLGQAALPGLVSAKEGRRKLYEEILRLCLVAFTFVGIAVAAGIPLVFELIDLVSGALGRHSEPMMVKYAEVPLLLRIVALGIPFVAFETVSNNYAVAEGRPKAVLYSNLATIAALLVTLYPLGKAYGLTGIVVAGIIGTMMKGGSYAVVLWRDFRAEMRAGGAWTLACFVACLAAMAGPQLYADWTFSWVLSFPAVAIYLAGVMLFGVLTPEDFRRVLRAYRARRSPAKDGASGA